MIYNNRSFASSTWGSKKQEARGKRQEAGSKKQEARGRRKLSKTIYQLQEVASIEDEERARRTMGVSYRYRTMLQFLWVILAIVVPVFNLVAGIVPLFIPSFTIKLRGILSAGKGG